MVSKCFLEKSIWNLGLFAKFIKIVEGTPLKYLKIKQVFLLYCGGNISDLQSKIF